MAFPNQPRTISVPDEVLLGIFSQLWHIPSWSDKRPRDLMILAAVCRQWKAVAYDECLWTHIDITASTTMRQLRFQLARSSAQPIAVSIAFQPWQYDDYDPGTVLPAVCRIMFTHVWRIRDLKIELCRNCTDDASDYGSWPFELTECLVSGDAWPMLRSLALINRCGSRHGADYLEVDIEAPVLETLSLQDIHVPRTPTIRVGSTLRDLNLTAKDSSGLVEAMLDWPNLHCLRLFDGRAMDDPGTLRFIMPRSVAPVFATLADLAISCIILDLPTLFSFLACCPRLECLSLELVAFQNPGDKGPSFQLQHLHDLSLVASKEASSSRNILSTLMPAVGAAPLRTLFLRDVNLESCEAIVGPSLQELTLYSVRCDTTSLMRALRQCQQLYVLRLNDLELSAHDESEADNAQPLPALREAILLDSRRMQSYATLSAGVVQPETRYLSRLFISLLPRSTIPVLRVGLPLAAEDTLHVCNGLSDRGPVSLRLRQHSTGAANFEVSAGTRIAPGHTTKLPFLAFFAESLVNSLRILASTVDMFALIAHLEVDLQSAVDFFTTVSPAGLPCVQEITLNLSDSYSGDPCKITTVLETLASLHGGIVCPSLHTVMVGDPQGPHEIPHPPARLRLPKTAVERFVEIFRSLLRVELKTRRVAVDPEDAEAAYLPDPSLRQLSWRAARGRKRRIAA